MEHIILTYILIFGFSEVVQKIKDYGVKCVLHFHI
jgi:hypothetical protein